MAVLTGGSMGPPNSVLTWSLVGSGVSDFTGFFPDGTVSFSSLAFNYEQAVRQAFDAWAAAANIEFIQVPDSGAEFGGLHQTFPDIRIGFGVLDGGGAPGFATFPFAANNGMVWLDSSQGSFWTPQTLFFVAMHELGHVLGLNHEPTNPAVMNAGANPDLTGLLADDINGIQSIYGAQDNGPNVYNMASGQANLTLLDGAPNLIINGNALNNAITGSPGAETLLGGGGNDILTGGPGDDRFFFAPGGGADTIADFEAGIGSADRIDLTVFTGIHSSAQVLALASQVGADTVINFGNGDTLTLQNVQKASLAGSDFAITPPTPFVPPSFELAAFAPGAGGWSSDNLYKRELADVNGDGRDDIIGFGQAGVYVSLAGNGHFAAPTFELAAFAPGAGGWSSDNLYKRELADVNGDGRDDIVGFGHAGVYVSLASGNGHFAAPTFELAAFAPGAGGWSSDDLYKRELADVNGDGRDDIVGFGHAGVYVSLASGNGHFAAPTFELAAFAPGAGGWSSDNLYKRELADVNGDGRADIVGFGQAGVYVALATDNGHFAAPTFELAAFAPGAGGWSSDDLYKREVADVNGDGTADLVGFGYAGVYVSLATGNGHFAALTLELAAFTPGAGGWSNDDLYKRELADVNGDFRDDIVGFGAAGVYVSQAHDILLI